MHRLASKAEELELNWHTEVAIVDETVVNVATRNVWFRLAIEPEHKNCSDSNAHADK